MTPGIFSCASVRLRGWYIYVVSDFVTLHLTDVWSRLELLHRPAHVYASLAHLSGPKAFLACPCTILCLQLRFGISDRFSGVLELSSLVCVCVHTFSMLELFSGPFHAPRPVLARKLRQRTASTSILLRAQRMANNGWEGEPEHSLIDVDVSRYISVFCGLLSECNIHWTSKTLEYMDCFENDEYIMTCLCSLTHICGRF